MGDKEVTPKDDKSKEGGTGESHSFVAKYYKKYLLEIEDVHFHHSSVVLLPGLVETEPKEKKADTEDHVDKVGGLDVISDVFDHAKANPSHKLLVAGHADTTGTIAYNLTISRLRAKNVYDVLMGVETTWPLNCQKHHKPEDYHHILWWIAETFLWDCHPKSISATDTPSTIKAVKGFQTMYNTEVDDVLKVDGIVGTETWRAIFHMYMWHLRNLRGTDEEGLEASRKALKFVDDDKLFVGCSEHFPIDHAAKDGYRSTTNRRVEILFFEPGEKPTLNCHPAADKCLPKVCLVYEKKGYKTVPVVIDPSKKPKKTLAVALQLQYKDPEDNARSFPADFPVIVEYLNGDRVDPVPRTKKNGLLTFEADKSKSSFTLRFELSPGSVYFSSGPDSSGENDGYLGDAGLEDEWLAGKRIMKMPGVQADDPEGTTWGIKESDWFESDGETEFDEATFEKLFSKSDGDIGTDASPFKLILDPHWQFVRFMFFDRSFGHSDHDNKQIAVPAIPLEGFREKPSQPDTAPDTLSTWMYKPDDAEAACQALPWILQRDEDGDDLAELNHDMLLRFRTLHSDSEDSDTKVGYVVSDAADSRKIEILDLSVPLDQARLELGPDRLKYYDLPPIWKSQSYYARFSATSGKFFEDLTEDEIADSFDAGKRIGFSLEDILIMIPNPPPIGAAPAAQPEFVPFTFQPQQSYTAPLKKPPIDTWNRIALFSHRFEGADDEFLSHAGLFRPDKDVAHMSKLEVSGAGHEMYIMDYANWTRLIIAQGDLFEVFDQRSPDTDDETVAVGARAAVRWAQSPAILPGAEVTAPPVTRTRSFVAVQHFYRQMYPTRGAVYTGAGGRRIGRFDIALLRCCDVADGKEVAVNVHYIKSYFHFNADPQTDATMDDDSIAHVSKAEFINKLLANVDKRWNGFKDGSSNFAKLVPKDDTVKLRINVVWVGQSLDHDLCHFKIDVESHKQADGAYGRDNRNGFYGTGKSRTSSYEDTGDFNGFTTAHESGHSNSLPDEYNERWDAASFGRQSFAGNLPGDPYELDGTTPLDVRSRESGMMNSNHKIRNRYFWHAAEWCRRILEDPPFKLTTSFKIALGAYDDYHVPPYSSHRSSYTYMPIEYGNDYTLADRGDTDLFLYTLGADKYSNAILAKGKGPFSGILMILVKMKFEMYTDNSDVIEEFLDEITKVVGGLFNEKWYATGKVGVGTDREWEFTEGRKCLLQFSPRYLVKRPSTPDYSGKNNAFLNTKDNSGTPVEQEAVKVVRLSSAFPNRFEFEVKKHNVLTTSGLKWVNPSPDRALKLDISTSILAKSWKVQLRAYIAEKFREMLGIPAGTAAITPAQILPIVQQVIKTNATVSSF